MKIMAHTTNNNKQHQIPPGLCGEPTESKVVINNIPASALLDTGSTVSTMSHSFYLRHLRHLPLELLEKLLHIECADGKALPYKGYIETEIYLPELQQSYSCIFLIVPDSPYHDNVPLLLGTNFLKLLVNSCKQQYGERFLQTTNLTTPWYSSFRCILLREKELTKNNNRLAVIKSAETKNITIPPNSDITIAGYVDREIPYHSTSAMVQPTKGSLIPPDLDIGPSLINYQHRQNGIVDINISNITTRTVTVPPRALLAEIQPVTILDPPERPDDEFTVPLLDQVKIDTNNLTPEQITQGTSFITSYNDIFSKSDIDVGHTDFIQHKIELDDDHPFKQRYRRIPPSMYEEVKSHIHQLLRAGIIQKSHSPWSSNVVLVKKKDGSLRMCVDFRQLNNRTKKDAYALPRIEDILDRLAGNKYFTVIDMKSGYHQVKIFEDHKERTAFTVGPLGLL